MISKRLKRVLGLLALTAAVTALSGCGEDDEIVLHEPGEYKGTVDDLDVDNDALADRFANQRDR